MITPTKSKLTMSWLVTEHQPRGKGLAGDETPAKGEKASIFKLILEVFET